MSNDKEIEERAQRRDKAIEENKNMLLNTIRDKEELLAIVPDVKNVLKGLTALRENLDYYLDMAMISDSAKNNVSEEFVSKILIALGEQVSKLIEIDTALSRTVYGLSAVLERMSVLLEIESKNAQESYKRIAEIYNIPYDESEELWLQKLLTKIEAHFERQKSKSNNS